jgi:hypothetical protein
MKLGPEPIYVYPTVPTSLSGGSGPLVDFYPVCPVKQRTFCRYCESELDESRKKCPNCGAPARLPN